MSRSPSHPVVHPAGRALRWLATHRDLPPIIRLAVAADQLDVQAQIGEADTESLDVLLHLAPRARVLLPALLAWHEVLSHGVITVEDRPDAQIAYVRARGLIPDELPQEIPVTVYVTLLGADRDLLTAGLGGATHGPVDAEWLRALADAAAAEGLPVGEDTAVVTG